MAHVAALLRPIWIPSIWVVQTLTCCCMPKFQEFCRRALTRPLCTSTPSNSQYMGVLCPYRPCTRSLPSLILSSLRVQLALPKFLWTQVSEIARNSGILTSKIWLTFPLLVAISLTTPLASYNTLQIRPIHMTRWIIRQFSRSKYRIGTRLVREWWRAVLPIHSDSWGFLQIRLSLSRLRIQLLARVLHILR